jgi:molybdopterin-guanine dinucleotide biosynthesis protein A
MLSWHVPQRILGVIPARFASSRFPGKALATLAGKTILQHVYERSTQARYLTDVVIATDDERIYDAARSFRAPVRMTSSDHLSGTDRVAEVASADSASVIVNIQGDEPLIDPTAIDAATLALLDDIDAPMATLKKRIEDLSEIENPNVVKVVTNHAGDAIYFSIVARPPAIGSTLGFTYIGATFYLAIPPCLSGRSKSRSVWNNCVHWRTATASASWRLSTSLSAWTPPRTLKRYRSCSKHSVQTYKRQLW